MTQDERDEFIEDIDAEGKANGRIISEYLSTHAKRFAESLARNLKQDPTVDPLVVMAVHLSLHADEFASHLHSELAPEAEQEEFEYDLGAAQDDAQVLIASVIGFLTAAGGFIRSYREANPAPAEAAPAEATPAPEPDLTLPRMEDGVLHIARSSPDAFFVPMEERARLN